MEQKSAKIDEALQNAGCSSADYIRYCLEQQRNTNDRAAPAGG